MKLRLIPLLAVLLGMALCSCTRKPKEDRTISVEATDPEMNGAIAKGRETLPSFWQAFDHREHGEEKFSLKVMITDGHRTEHFWANDIERKDGKIFGTINNDPEIVKNVRMGERIEIPDAQISDWLYLRDDKMIGNYTLRVLFKQMPAKEVEYWKQRMAEP
jgi:uncharacterized protein YegJ (DUF2314 family)